MRQVGLDDEKALTSITKAIISAKRIVVVAGAGMSTSAGIPDFRSKHGLYTCTKSGPSIFSAAVYASPAALQDHLKAMASLHEATAAAKPTPTHRFIKQLNKRGRLLRAYTQNIDCLEDKAGLECVDLVTAATSPTGNSRKRKRVTYDQSVVQLHGNVHSVRCSVCAYEAPWSSEHTSTFASGRVDECPTCEQAANERAKANLRRRKTDRSYLRPNVALYDEEHRHADTLGDIVSHDLAAKPDLLLVIGTALKVNGARRLVKDLAKAVRAKNGTTVRVDMQPGTSEWKDVFDWHVMGSCDDVTGAILKEWKATRPQDWQSQPKMGAFMSSSRPLLSPSVPKSSQKA